MEPKPWYKSKTIWAHILALAAYVADRVGVAPFQYSPEQLLFFDAIAGIILRFVTKKPVTAPLAGAAKEV